MADSLHSLEAKDKILKETLKYVPTEGWTLQALGKGVVDAGFEPNSEYRVFQGNIHRLMDHYFSFLDQKLLTELDKIDLTSMRIRDRITTAVWVSLKLLQPYREVTRVTMAHFTHPARAIDGGRYLFRTLDHIWYKAGDRSTDFNYYSKRGLLAGVYLATLRKWLNDHSFDHMETRAFLDRRIENVMIIPKIKSVLRTAFSYFMKPSSNGAFNRDKVDKRSQY